MKLNYADLHELGIMRGRIGTIANEAYNSNAPFNYALALNKYSKELENIKVRTEELLTETDQKERINFLASCNMQYA